MRWYLAIVLLFSLLGASRPVDTPRSNVQNETSACADPKIDPIIDSVPDPESFAHEKRFASHANRVHQSVTPERDMKPDSDLDNEFPEIGGDARRAVRRCA